MSKLGFVVCALILVAAAASQDVIPVKAVLPRWVSDAEAYQQFEAFQADYARSYATEAEQEYRFGVFQTNLKRAAEYQRVDRGTAEYGVTRFSDMTQEEFASFYLGLNTSMIDATSSHMWTPPAAVGATPASIDYVALGKVTAVKDQGTCGSCWAFSAASHIESRFLMMGLSSLSLSTQQLVDCATAASGCDGGLPSTAYAYVFNTGGQESWADYPYTAVDGTCKFAASKVRVKLPSATTTTISPTDITRAASLFGPMSAALDATPLQAYRSGVINLPASSCPSLNHAVNLVGYNTAVSPNYFKIRNSWSSNWGESGYFRISPSSCLISTLIQYAGRM